MMDAGEPRFDEILMSSSPGRCPQEEEENEIDGKFNLNGETHPPERKALRFTSNPQTRTPTSFNSHWGEAEMKLQSSRNPSATSLVQAKNGNGLSSSFSIWVNDVQALTSSHEFRCAIDSSSKLILATTGKVIHTALLPITIPVNITTSIASNVIRAANGTICHIVKPFVVNNQQLSALRAETFEGVANSHIQDDECDHLTQCQPHIHEKLICAAINVIPVAVGTVARVRDEIGSTLINVLGWHMPSDKRSGGNQNVPNQSCDPLQHYPTKKNSKCENNMPNEESGESISCEDETKCINSSLSEDVGEISSPVKLFSGSSNEANISGDAETTFSIAICDLGICKPLSSGSKDELIVRLELKAHPNDREIIDIACTKMVDKVLFLSCMNIDKRSKEVTRRPAWKEEGSTLKYHKQYNKWIGNTKTKNKAIALMEKEVMMWSFTAKKKTNKKKVYGDGVPMFRAKGIIPCSPLELLDLLLDSSKVSLYNKHSNGRKDVCILYEGGKESRGCGDGTIITKIMRTETKIPLTGKVIQMQTLLHARKIKEEGHVGDTFVLVSRSVDSSSCGREEVKSARSKNEIIWGVNVLREVAGYENKVELTNFSQANSTAVPNFLAHKIGLISLNDFFKNLREMKREGNLED